MGPWLLHSSQNNSGADLCVIGCRKMWGGMSKGLRLLRDEFIQRARTLGNGQRGCKWDPCCQSVNGNNVSNLRTCRN